MYISANTFIITDPLEVGRKVGGWDLALACEPRRTIPLRFPDRTPARYVLPDDFCIEPKPGPGVGRPARRGLSAWIGTGGRPDPLPI